MQGAIESIQAHEVIRPLRTTFSTSLGSKQYIHNVIVTVMLRNRIRGVGEIPSSFAFREETITRVREVLSEAGRRLKGNPVEAWPEMISELRRTSCHAPMTISGLEVALFRACLLFLARPEPVFFGTALSRFETDITIPFLMQEDLILKWIGYASGKGFKAYKLKVSGDPKKDERVLTLVYETLQANVPGFTLRLDGNQGYTAGTFRLFIDTIEKKRYEIELFEQPLPKDDLRGLSLIKPTCPIPVILDETVVTYDDARRVIDNGLCDGINIKMAKSGIGQSSEIIDYALRHKVKLMIGCMTETMVGLSAAVFLAAGTGVFDYIDLDSVYFLYGANSYAGLRREGPAFVIEPSTNFPNLRTN